MTLAAAIAVGAATAANPGVDPQTVAQTVNPGDSFTVDKVVHTPAIPPKPDVVFLADTTGSMGPAIANVQANATAIMNDVRTAQADSQFGAASYKDFNCDAVPFSLDQSITAVISDAQNGINSWSAGGGCDTPEAQLNALYELATNPAVGFRSDSTRIIVWFGDSSGHDPSNGHTIGDAIAALQAAGIEVIAVPVDSGFGDGLDSTGQATQITSPPPTGAGGVLLPGATPSQVSNAILAGLTNLPVTVTPSPTCDPDLSISFNPAGSQTVTSGSDVNYVETLTVSASNPGGVTLHCTVKFLLNGIDSGDAFTESIDVTVNAPPNCTTVTGGPDLWPPNHKMRLITLTGATDPDGDTVTLTVTGVTQDEPLNGLADGNTSPDATPGPTSNQVNLRAERSGTGDGRVYRISFTGSDGRGGTCSGTVTVGVPHDQGQGSVPIDSGGIFVDF